LFAVTDLLPSLDPNDFDAELVARVRSDPEHDTVQFVVKAIPLSDDERISEIVSRVSMLESELLVSNEKGRRLQLDLDGLREEASSLAALNNQLSSQQDAATEAVFGLETELATLREESSGLALNDQLSAQREKIDIESFEQLTEELRERREDVAGLSAALAASQTMRERLAADLRYQEAKVGELESLRDRIAELERERASLSLVLDRERTAQHEGAAAIFVLENERAAMVLSLEVEHSALEQERERTLELATQLERAQATVFELETRVEAERAEVHRANRERAAFEESIARLHQSSIQQTRVELRKVLEEIALTDAAIQATYRSRAWALKRLLGAIRVRAWGRTKRR
jgi:chromosome segregation ATPase